MRNGSLCLDQALSSAFSVPVDRLLRGKAEFRGELPKEDFPVSRRARVHRAAAVPLGAAQWLSVEERCGGHCLQEYLGSLALPHKVLQTLVSGPFICLLTNRRNYMLNCFTPNALSSEGGSQVFRCPQSQVFLHGKSMLNAWRVNLILCARTQLQFQLCSSSSREQLYPTTT